MGGPTKQWRPTPYQRTQIAARAVVHPRTVEKAYKPQPVRSSVAQRIAEAARALQFPEPPHP